MDQAVDLDCDLHVRHFVGQKLLELLVAFRLPKMGEFVSSRGLENSDFVVRPAHHALLAVLPSVHLRSLDSFEYFIAAWLVAGPVQHALEQKILADSLCLFERGDTSREGHLRTLMVMDHDTSTR